MSQTISVINRSGHAIFYTHQTSGACAGVCVCVCVQLHASNGKDCTLPFFHVTSYLKNINILSSRLFSLESKLLPKKITIFVKDKYKTFKKKFII